MQLKNKIIVLTGASGGIGEAISKKLADAGGSIIAVGRDKAKLNALISSLPGQHSYVVADLITTEGIQAIVDEVNNRGGVDVLINNAGITQFGLLEHQSSDVISAQLNANLLAPILLTQALLPALKKSDSPAIVNMGSTFGSIGYSGFSAYCASKFGLRGFTEALRRELADTAIRLFYLAPRATRTPINNAQVVAMNQELGNKMDEPEVVASHLMKLLQSSNILIRYIGWPEKLFVLINSVLPQVVDKALFKQLPVIRRFAQH